MIAASTKLKLMGPENEEATTSYNTTFSTTVSEEKIKEGVLVTMGVEGSLRTFRMLSSEI